MRSILSLLLFTLLISATQLVQAADPDPGQPGLRLKPPLGVLDNRQKQTVPPSLPLALQNQGQKTGAIEDIRDIQGPLILLKSKSPWIFITIGALLLLLLGLFFFFRKRKKKTIPRLPAHEIALAELAKAKLWMTESKGILYAQRLSEILRQYIESRFFVQSTRQTTDELLVGLQSCSSLTNEKQPYLGDLQTCLERCDMAKFAHLPPNDQSMALMESAVRHFIETTRPVQQTGETA